jgi:DNA replication and repair protein RecF
MKLDYIKITNFRNFSRIILPRFSRINMLIGENGSGKTNFLEAIQTLTTLSPLRPVGFPELIRWGSDFFHLHGEFDGHTVELGFSEKKRLLKIDGDKSNKAGLARIAPVVAFMPDDIDIIRGAPENRRMFLDRALSAIDPQYETALRRYYRTLRQRNAQFKLNPRDVTIWDAELIDWGSMIIMKRLPYIRILNDKIRELYRELYGREIRIRYMNPFRIEGSVEESFRNAVKTGAREELRRRCTLFGPHRDNFCIQMDDKKSDTFVSQGQLRSLAFALKLGVVRSIEDSSGGRPILLVDDVLLEIDEVRREKILDMISMDYQIFFTMTNGALISRVFADCSVFQVNGGEIALPR